MGDHLCMDWRTKAWEWSLVVLQLWMILVMTNSSFIQTHCEGGDEYHLTQFTVLVEGLNLISLALCVEHFLQVEGRSSYHPSVIQLHDLQETCNFIWIVIAKAKPYWIQRKELISPRQVFDRFDRVSSEITRKQILTGTNFLFTGLYAFLNIAQGRSGTLAATTRPSLVWGSPARPAVLTLIDRVWIHNQTEKSKAVGLYKQSSHPPCQSIWLVFQYLKYIHDIHTCINTHFISTEFCTFRAGSVQSARSWKANSVILLAILLSI